MKSAPVALLTDIAKRVTSFATLITLVRGDGTTLNFTQHDRPITFNGVYFRNDIPYNLSAIDTNSDLSADSTTLDVAIDGTVFTHRDIANDVYRGGQIEIALVDWKNLDAGKMILRQGWFTQLQDNRPQHLSLEIGGLMKVLDMGVGRTYQPGCDADLGDSRCRIALDPSQAYAPINPVVQGDWTYIYDKTLMTAIAGTNLDFETGDLTGWDVSTGASWAVTTTPHLPSSDGAEYLMGGASSATEQFVAQTFDLSAITAADIDAGKIAIAIFTRMAQIDDLTTSFPKTVVDILDADGNIIDTHDTRYLTMDTDNAWRERCQHVNLKPGARSVRYYLYGKTKTGTLAQLAFDKVEPYWYDITASSPNHNLIFKCVRTVDWTNPAHIYAIGNPGFESFTASVDTTENIPNWTKAGNIWGTRSTALSGVGVPRDTRFLIVGDNASGIQSDYTISQTIDFNASWVSLARLAQGKYVSRFSGIVVFGDTTSQAGCDLEFFDADGASLGVIAALEMTTNPTTAAVPFECTLTLPVHTASMKITLKVKSPPASSTALIGFDGLVMYMVDAERSDSKVDPATAFGDPATEFSFTSGTYSQDGNVIWRAFPALRMFDTVATVTDRKLFTGTNIVGGAGAYETAKIEWLSGANAGRTGLIRTWNFPTKGIKTYFPQLHPIQVGDRFAYYPSCQKRFKEDCVFKFNNAINFQGFPYLPGAIAPNTGGTSVNTPGSGSTTTGFLSNPQAPVVTTSNIATFPAALAEGDLLVIIAWSSSSDSIAGAPAGWRLRSSGSNISGASKCSSAAYTKVATAQDVIDGSVTLGASITLNACLSATPTTPIVDTPQSAVTVFNSAPSPLPADRVLAITQPLLNGAHPPGIAIAITGANGANTIATDDDPQIIPAGQDGVVQKQTFVNLLSSQVGTLAFATASVRATFFWVLDGSPGNFALQLGTKSGGVSIALGVFLPIVVQETTADSL